MSKPLPFKQFDFTLAVLSFTQSIPRKDARLKKINIPRALESLDEYWSQKIIGEANGSLYKVAKGIGSTNWHKHDDQDELFIVYKGRLTVQLRTESIELEEGEMLIIPRGIEHCPKADDEVQFVIAGLNITSNDQGGKPEWSYS